SGEKVPRFRIGLPLLCVFREHLRLIALGIKCNREQHEASSHLIFKVPLHNTEIIGNAIAEIWQSATGVDKVEGHDFAGKLRKRNGSAILVDQGEIWNLLPDRQQFWAIPVIPEAGKKRELPSPPRILLC